MWVLPFALMASAHLGQDNHVFLPAIQVLNRKGVPVGGAYVVEIPRQQNLYPHFGTTVSDGVYSVMSLGMPADLYASDGTYVARKQIRSPLDFQAKAVPVHLRKLGASFEGVVQDESGHPLPGATVKCIRWRKQGGTYTSEYKTKADGKFRFGGLWDAFQYSFETSADGYGKIQGIAKHACQEGKTSRLAPIRLPVASSYVEGQLIDDRGYPVADARVSLVIYPDRSVTTDKDGLFRFDALPKGSHMLVIWNKADYMDLSVDSGKKSYVIFKKDKPGN